MEKTKKMALWQAACLLLAYLVARYGLFSLHGMKQWPAILLALGVVYLLLAWWRKLPALGFASPGGIYWAWYWAWPLRPRGRTPGAAPPATSG